VPPKSAFAGFRFPPEVIVVAIRWYLRFNLSYRDVEELLVERGVEVDHVTVFRWVQRFTPLLADAARFARHLPGDRWYVETYVKVNGVWRYVYRAVDQHGQVIDVLVSARRDAVAARRFFQRALRTLKVQPSEVVTDGATVYPAVLDELIPSALRARYRGSTRAADHSCVHRTHRGDLTRRPALQDYHVDRSDNATDPSNLFAVDRSNDAAVWSSAITTAAIPRPSSRRIRTRGRSRARVRQRLRRARDTPLLGARILTIGPLGARPRAIGCLEHASQAISGSAAPRLVAFIAAGYAP
jgi:transposase-like protein